MSFQNKEPEIRFWYLVTIAGVQVRRAFVCHHNIHTGRDTHNPTCFSCLVEGKGVFLRVNLTNKMYCPEQTMIKL